MQKHVHADVRRLLSVFDELGFIVSTDNKWCFTKTTKTDQIISQPVLYRFILGKYGVSTLVYCAAIGAKCSSW